MTDNLTHKLGPPGYCKARHIREPDDYCNEPVVKGGEYCFTHTCIIPGCLEQEVAVYPLLPDVPRFCSKHYEPEFTKKYGVDQSPTYPDDDYDIIEDNELDFGEIPMDDGLGGPAES